MIPGDGRGSVLYQRLVADDPDERMPWGMEPLTSGQIEIVRSWIDAGVPWPEGVTVAAPGRPTAPAISDRTHLQFNRDVRPILADCYTCHGPDRNRRQAGLRLDREEAAKAALPSGAIAIVPGDPEKSALLERVSDPDEARRMPHVSSGKPRLSASQIATLRQWIAECALWEPHWSYIPPKRPERLPVPAVAHPGWPKNAVDSFVLAGMEKGGLGLSPEADRSELLRRLSFDLAGLPPTPEEVREFASDLSREAYEKQVDRLLASPHYGERMAMYLDLVRYSDSVGYHSDNSRPLWRYRDWVVSAFNQNLPFDRFTLEQLAGDLLPDPTFEQKIASGYNRLLHHRHDRPMGRSRPGTPTPFGSRRRSAASPRSDLRRFRSRSSRKGDRGAIPKGASWSPSSSSGMKPAGRWPHGWTGLFRARTARKIGNCILTTDAPRSPWTLRAAERHGHEQDILDGKGCARGQSGE